MRSKATNNCAGEEVRNWLHAVADMPSARTEKVQQIKVALQRCSYENERMLDETIERLSRDLGLLA